MKTRLSYLKSENLASEDPDVLAKSFNIGPVDIHDRASSPDLPHTTLWDLLQDNRRVGRDDRHTVSVDQEIGERSNERGKERRMKMSLWLVEQHKRSFLDRLDQTGNRQQDDLVSRAKPFEDGLGSLFEVATRIAGPGVITTLGDRCDIGIAEDRIGL